MAKVRQKEEREQSRSNGIDLQIGFESIGRLNELRVPDTCTELVQELGDGYPARMLTSVEQCDIDPLPIELFNKSPD